VIQNHDATATVTRVVDGDTIDISPSVEGRSRVRLIGMDTPEVSFGTQPYGREASDYAKRELEGDEVGLELDVQKIDPYGRFLAYVYLPDGQMFNETLLEEGHAQVATFPPNVKYVERFLEAQREARGRVAGCGGSPPDCCASRPTLATGSAGDALVPRPSLNRRINRIAQGAALTQETAIWTVRASKPTNRRSGF
jgi:micrococcal nuclease